MGNQSVRLIPHHALRFPWVPPRPDFFASPVFQAYNSFFRRIVPIWQFLLPVFALLRCFRSFALPPFYLSFLAVCLVSGNLPGFGASEDVSVDFVFFCNSPLHCCNFLFTRCRVVPVGFLLPFTQQPCGFLVNS